MAYDVSVIPSWFLCTGIANCVAFLFKASFVKIYRFLKIVSEYDQEIPQSQTADNPLAP